MFMYSYHKFPIKSTPDYKLQVVTLKHEIFTQKEYFKMFSY